MMVRFNFGNALDLAKRFSTSGLLVGSAMIMEQQRRQESTTATKPWCKIEYPTEPAPKEDVLLSRKVNSALDKTGLNLRLYQYQTCPYCCKLRAFLDYFAFSYEVVEVNPVTRSQIKFSKDYKKVPIMTSSCCDQPLIESSLIVSVLASFLQQKNLSLKEALECYPEHMETDQKTGKVTKSFLNKFFVMYGEEELSDEQMQALREEREWREWVDEHFIHLISPNVYRTWSESLETFNFFDEVGDWKRNFPAWERFLAIYVGAFAMFMISKRLKKRHNIVDERQSMEDAFDKFIKAKGQIRRFMGGDRPNLADLALYGAINSFYGCSAFKEMRDRSQIGKWYDDMHMAVQEGWGKKFMEKKCSST